jgi:hypothetical protein
VGADSFISLEGHMAEKSGPLFFFDVLCQPTGVEEPGTYSADFLGTWEFQSFPNSFFFETA